MESSVALAFRACPAVCPSVLVLLRRAVLLRWPSSSVLLRPPREARRLVTPTSYRLSRPWWLIVSFIKQSPDRQIWGTGRSRSWRGPLLKSSSARSCQVQVAQVTAPPSNLYGGSIALVLFSFHQQIWMSGPGSETSVSASVKNGESFVAPPTESGASHPDKSTHCSKVAAFNG